jgi:hypothetical protein
MLVELVVALQFHEIVPPTQLLLPTTNVSVSTLVISGTVIVASFAQEIVTDSSAP